MKTDIEDWIVENKHKIGFDSEIEIKDISKGESNHTFEIECLKSDQSKILRTSLSISDDRIKHESKILTLLENLNLQDVPRKIYYQEKTSLNQPILVETFVGTADIETKDLNKKQVKNLAHKLAKIHSIEPKEYNKFMKAETPSKSTLGYEFREDFKKYSKTPFEAYKKLSKDIDKRITNFYKKQKEIVKEAENVGDKLSWGMCHGDISHNIRINSDNSLSLIDWELARPGIPRFELVYLFKHSKFSKSMQNSFLEEYEKVREIPSVAEAWSNKRWKFLAFNDMIWAAKRKEKLKHRGKDYFKYEKLFEKRLKELEELYNNPK